MTQLNLKGLKRMKGLFCLILVLAIIGISSLYGETVNKPVEKPKPLIQAAILLDTSSSMDGLIEQAKSQLWKIINEMALAKKNNTPPKIEVALYEYGKSSVPSQNGYIRLIVPLSQDLDKISDELFKLTTNGGDEYCGQVIQTASRDLKWSPDNQNLKVIFIAGNEEFTQGKINYKEACKEAITKGIIINTIFCGNFNEGVNTFWKDGADLADGKYINIDQDQKAEQIDAPQDKEIIALGQKLNETYVGYGHQAEERKEMQKKQDTNAVSAGSASMVERSVAKASSNYSNVMWDIVDAEKDGKVKVEDLPEDQLPTEMKKMSKTERKAYIEKKKKERAELQAKIAKLKQDRDKYVTEQRKKITAKDTLDEAIINAVKQQAKSKNFQFDKDKK